MEATSARSLRCSLLLSAVALISVVCLGQKSAKPGPSQTGGPYQNKLRDEAFIKEGAAIFVPSCSSSYCHGSAGMGGAAPHLRGRDLEASYIFRTVSNGIPGTPMIGFKSDLTEEQRWKVVAFILSPVGPKVPAAGSVAGSSASLPAGAGESAAAASKSPGDAATGSDLFYDLANQRSCHGCHAVRGVGGKVGPDLGMRASALSADELMSTISKPHTVGDSKYTTVTITLADGDRIVGIKKDENGDLLRVYDTTVLPAVLRTMLKSEIVKTEISEQSIMPGNYTSVYTEKQLADIIAFIKSPPTKSER